MRVYNDRLMDTLFSDDVTQEVRARHPESCTAVSSPLRCRPLSRMHTCVRGTSPPFPPI